MDQKSFLEGRDGADFSRSSVFGEDHICECYCGKFAYDNELSNSNPDSVILFYFASFWSRILFTSIFHLN